MDCVFYFSEEENKWKHNYIILSNAYFYLYDTNRQEFPTCYYYIVDGSVKDHGKNELTGLYEITISNNYGTCQIGCKNEKQRNEWISILNDHLKIISRKFESNPISLNKNIIPEIPDPSVIISKLKCSINKIMINLHKKNQEDWMNIQLEQTEFNLIMRPYDFEANSHIKTINLTDVQDPSKFSKILDISEDTEALCAEVKGQSKLSPIYKVFI